MVKLKNWLTKQVSTERPLEGEIELTYTEQDEADAPSGHMPLPRTDCEVVACPVNEHDLMLLMNKGGVCVYRTILAGVHSAATSTCRRPTSTWSRPSSANRRSRCAR